MESPPAKDADERQADLLRDLRVIDEIARFHRTWGRAGQRPRIPTWSHFTIVEQVGAGAFGAVFRATDEKLQREVALNCCRRRIPTDRYVRVLKEARLLARVPPRERGGDCAAPTTSTIVSASGWSSSAVTPSKSCF
jgi:hypothetical protein